MPARKSAKKRERENPDSHHIDRRAELILDVEPKDNDDELLAPPAVSEWIGMSEQWLADGRCNGYGPPFLKYGARSIRYRRGDLRHWLRSRTFVSTKEVPKRESER